MYKLVIFDLDGTLLDTQWDLADAVNHVLLEAGFPERRIEEIRSYVGNGVRSLIERSVPDGTSDEIIDRVLADYKEYYGTHSSIKTKPYDGIHDMLSALREAGIKTALLSNKSDPAVKELCNIYFEGMLDYAAGEKPGIPRKPSPDSLLAIVKDFGLEKCDCVYVGDSEVDVETARNGGLDLVCVDWGFRSREELCVAGAVCIVSDADLLTDKLLGKE